VRARWIGRPSGDANNNAASPLALASAGMLDPPDRVTRENEAEFRKLESAPNHPAILVNPGFLDGRPGERLAIPPLEVGDGAAVGRVAFIEFLRTEQSLARPPCHHAPSPPRRLVKSSKRYAAFRRT